MAQHGRTVLFVSHNIDAVSTLCPRCLLMQDGGLEALGSTADVVARYLGADLATSGAIEFEQSVGEARFRSAALFDSTGSTAPCFRTGATIGLRCCFQVLRALPGLEIAFSVLTFKGERLFYSSNVMARPRISVEAAGTHNITAMIPPTLLPGRYTVNLALHRPHVQTYDFRERVL